MAETMSAELPRISAINMTPSTDEIHVWTNVSERPTGEDMDTEREKSIVYNYLCRLEEAKRWVEAMSQSNLPAVTEGMEESLANGIVLAKLGKAIAPSINNRIFDENEEHYAAKGLHFRHTDNINIFRAAMAKVSLPASFYPETTDIYDKKNLPRLIYCIHALAMHLSKLGKAPKIDDLEGILKFTEEEMSAMQMALDGYGIKLPSFAKIGGILAAEISEDEALHHAAILRINQALDEERPNNFDDLKEALLNEDARIQGVTASNISAYAAEMKQFKNVKAESHSEESLEKIDINPNSSFVSFDNDDIYLTRLTHTEVQSNILRINAAKEKERVSEEIASREQLLIENRLEAVQAVNELVAEGEVDEIFKALQNPYLEVGELDEAFSTRYASLLQSHLECYEELGYDDIKEIVYETKENFQFMEKRCSAVMAINLLLDEEDFDEEEQLEEMLLTDVLELQIFPDSVQAYYEALVDAKVKKDSNLAGSIETDWIVEIIDASEFFFDTLNLKAYWEAPDSYDFKSKQKMLSLAEIKNVVDEVTAALNKMEDWQRNVEHVTKIQSAIRMFLQKRAYQSRLQYLNEQEEATRTIQAFYRGWKARKEMRDRKKHWRTNTKSVVILQSYFRMLKERLRYVRRLKFLREQEDAVVRIQSWWRSCYVRNDYKGLSKGTATLRAVRHFVHLLQHTELDLREEEEICQLKKEIINRVRENEDLDIKLDQMDVKIGLLVKNRISLNDASNHLKKIRKQKQSTASLGARENSTVNLGRLTKETQQLVDSYEKLFALLQSEPIYFSKLLFCLPMVKSNSFVQNIVFATYDYAQHKREQYLLLKLFRSALEEEISQKVATPRDLMTNSVLAVKLIVNFYRGIGMKLGSGTSYGNKESLRDILGERVKEIISRSDELDLEWSIVETYKKWAQRKETEDGVQVSTIDSEITEDKAAAIPEVVELFEENINKLNSLVDGFLTSITASVKSLPYGLRYQAKVMYEALARKFPDASEELLLVSVGNLIYYRFLNPAICAPEAFDVIDLPAGTALDQKTRKKLGQIARFLQHSASFTTGKDIADGSLPPKTAKHETIQAATVLNSKRFRTFFKAVINVAEPEEFFQMSKYSDVVEIEKPKITLTIKDLLEAHKLLLQFSDSITADQNDQLHDILAEIKDIPEPEALLGSDIRNIKDSDALSYHIHLTLAVNIDQSDEDAIAADMRKLLSETKRLLCIAIEYQSSRNLREYFNEVVPFETMKKYSADKQSNLMNDRELIKANVKTLIANGILESEDDLVKSICEEIRENNRIRKARKLEIEQLRLTRARLISKRKYYEEQREFYERYISDCLAKQAIDDKQAKAKSAKGGSFRLKSRKEKKEVKYSADQLIKKGVLLSLDGDEVKNTKHLKFVIKPLLVNGQWSIEAFYLGVSVFTTKLILQELLQKQYENVSVVKLDDKAKVNVNLLIHLLNKKFHTAL